jgi:hypothetical protein
LIWLKINFLLQAMEFRRLLTTVTRISSSRSCRTETTITTWFNETSGQNQTDMSTWSNCTPLTEEERLALGLGLGLGLGIPLLLFFFYIYYKEVLRYRLRPLPPQHELVLRLENAPNLPRIVQNTEPHEKFQTAFSPEAYKDYMSGTLSETLMLELMVERVRKGKDLTEIQVDAIEKGHANISDYIQNMNITAFPPEVFQMAK